MTRSTAAELAGDVGHQLGRRPVGPRPRCRLARPLSPPGVLVPQLAPRRALEPPHHAVGVAGEVGEHVARRSSRAAGSDHRAVVVGQAVEVGLEGGLCSEAAVDPLPVAGAGARRARH